MVNLLVDSTHRSLLQDEEGSHSLGQFIDEWHNLLDCERELLTAPLDGLPRVTERGSAVLILVAPTRDLNIQEIESVLAFIRGGGSLFIAYNSRSLESLQTDCLEVLGENLGFNPQIYLKVPPNTIDRFSVHYISSGIDRITTVQPAGFEVLDDKKFVSIAGLNETTGLIGCAQLGRGRVVVSADINWLADRSWDRADNANLGRNIIRWLVSVNPIDCRLVPLESSEFFLEEPITLSMILSNPQDIDLGRIRCELESDHGSMITPSVESVRFLPAGGQTWIQWSILPKMLGNQDLQLRISMRHGGKRQTLVFPAAVNFNVLADVDLELHFETESETDITRIMIDNPFVAVGTINWRSHNGCLPTTLDLRFPKRAFYLSENSRKEAHRWYLTGRKPGDYTFTLILPQTGQRTQRRIQVLRGLDQYIQRVREELVPRVEAEVLPTLKRLRSEFCDSKVIDTAFNVLTPEEYAKLVFSPIVAKQILAAIEVARQEQNPNTDLMRLLARNIVPMFLPLVGSCIPFDPDLAAQMGNWDTRYRDELEANFLALDFSDEVTIMQNLAAYILHEKYGHGFFYNQTRVGQQLAILGRHKFFWTLDKF